MTTGKTIFMINLCKKRNWEPRHLIDYAKTVSMNVNFSEKYTSQESYISYSTFWILNFNQSVKQTAVKTIKYVFLTVQNPNGSN